MCLLAAPAAAETITYTYDALGRLVTVTHAGGRNDGVNAVYNYDKADNRTSVQVTGNNLPVGGATGAGVSSNTIYIVVPLNGFATVRAK
ncbi:MULTISPECIES: RHS repeat domain-containing protein [Sphingomonas]|uniref:RHS repeat domain-containing protein n=1 Tax=Sphingomonas TaxID=13687 RepID=UPI000DEF56CE|nr:MULTISPECIES: RHS repeat domain-containing protein [Sphingomonas]